MSKQPKSTKQPTPAKKPDPIKVNKSQAVRDYLKEHPRTANKDVAEALSKQGIKMLPDYVATVKGNMKTKKGKRKRRQQAAEVSSVKTGIGIAEIKAAFALLKHCGGITQAREALAAAVEIQKIL
jgi:geranylgeranyl pyrophosphate synthase